MKLLSLAFAFFRHNETHSNANNNNLKTRPTLLVSSIACKIMLKEKLDA
jgi:hypothetical protein